MSKKRVSSVRPPPTVRPPPPDRRPKNRPGGTLPDEDFRGAKPSVLIVDDADDGREMLVEYLAFQGYSVSQARHGAEAMDVARRIQPDIVLMDLSMPIVDGCEATRELKADTLTIEILIIAVTGHAFQSEQESARAAGCDAIVVKPFDLAVLASELDCAFAKGLVTCDASAGVTSKGALRKRSSTVASCSRRLV